MINDCLRGDCFQPFPTTSPIVSYAPREKSGWWRWTVPQHMSHTLPGLELMETMEHMEHMDSAPKAPGFSPDMPDMEDFPIFQPEKMVISPTKTWHHRGKSPENRVENRVLWGDDGI